MPVFAEAMSVPARLRRRRSAVAALAAVAATELACGLVLLGAIPGRTHRPAPAVAGRASSGPGRETPAPAGAPTLPAGPATTVPGAMAPPATTPQLATGPPPGHQSGAAVTGGSSPGSTAPAPPAGAGPAGTASGATGTQPVSCQTDLALSAAPDTGYDFLCTQGSTPLTWSKSDVVVYDQGLSPLQAAAFTTAIAQWEAAARFKVTYTGRPAGADVVVTDSALTAEQPGYTEDGYTTVSYRCQAVCAYYHADVRLSSSAALTQTNWVSTILHELGHVAGLNHVSKPGEVMYPYLSLTSPVAYAAGDRAGLAVLASERGA